MIRECFSTSILLGSLDNPVLPSSTCSPEPVESDVITACLCTSDMCNDLSSDSEPRGIIPETRVTTLPPRVTQDSRRERTFSPSRNPFNQFTTESFRSVTSPTSSPAVISVPSRNTNRRILCYKCGSLFSRDGNDRQRWERFKFEKWFWPITGWESGNLKLIPVDSGAQSLMSRILVSRVFVNLMKFVSCTLGKSLGEHETISGLFLEFSGIGRWSNKKQLNNFL